MTNQLQDELPLSNRQRRGPQRPEKRFSHNPANHGKSHHDEAKPAIEHNAILMRHTPSQSLSQHQDRQIIMANYGDNTAQV